MPGLFIVSKAAAPQEVATEPESESSQVTGKAAADLEMALRCAAFLIEWIETVGVEGLRQCAEAVRAWPKES